MKTRRMILATVLASVSVLYMPTEVTQAQQNGPLTLALSGAEAQATLAYWTPERLASAQPMPLPRPAFTPETAPEPQLAGTPQGSNGRAPSVNVRADFTNLLYDPATAQIEPEVASDEGVEPENHGTFRGALYELSSRAAHGRHGLPVSGRRKVFLHNALRHLPGARPGSSASA